MLPAGRALHRHPALLVLLGIAVVSYEAVPRIDDGAENLRTVHLTMPDEREIMEGAMQMVERGDLHFGVPVYPGFYPYQVGLVRLIVGAHVKTAVMATRILSLAYTAAALVLAFFLFGRLSGERW